MFSESATSRVSNPNLESSCVENLNDTNTETGAALFRQIVDIFAKAGDKDEHENLFDCISQLYEKVLILNLLKAGNFYVSS